MAQYSTSLLVVTALLCAGCNSDSGAGDASPNTPTDPPTVLPTLRVADATGPEGDVGDTTLRFEVTLSALSADPVSVDYESANDTALAGPGQRMTLACGATSRWIQARSAAGRW